MDLYQLLDSAEGLGDGLDLDHSITNNWECSLDIPVLKIPSATPPMETSK
jgi:hypothetical protein